LKKSHFLAVGISSAALFASGVGLTVASVYDWSTSPSANSTADPGINWAEGMLPSAVNDSARATMAAIAAWLRDATVVTTGASNAYVVTPTQAMRAWSPGYFSFVTNRANTGAATISVSGLAPKPLRAVTGASLASGQIINGGLYIASYNPTADEVLLTGKFGIINSDFAQMAAATVKANITSGAATPTDVTLAAFFGSAPSGSIPASALAASGISGEVRAFNLTSCPGGWILADGASGSPDLRGTVVRGLDSGRGLDPGRALATFQADSFASHAHGVSDPGHHHGEILASLNTSAIFVGSIAPVSPAFSGNSGSTTDANTGISIQNTGGSETRGKNVALLYCYHT
jgi:hypothetical protein